MNNICVRDDYGELKKVMVFRPGPEVESCLPGPLSLDPAHVGKWYWPPEAVQKDFDAFVDLMRAFGAEVFDVRQLLAEILAVDTETILQETLGVKFSAYADCGVPANPRNIVEDLICGVPRSFSDRRIIGPLQYASWLRDYATVIGDSVFLWPIIVRRRPAGRIIRAIVRHHPLFSGVRVFDFLESDLKIEGGDVVALSGEAVAIGVGLRTDLESAKAVAKAMIDSGVIRVAYIVEVPQLYEVIHLDQVFASIGPQAVLAMPYVFDEPEPYEPLVQQIAKWLDVQENNLPFGLKGHTVWIAQGLRFLRGEGFLRELCQDGFVKDVVWIGGEAIRIPSTEHFRIACVEAARQAANVFCLSPFHVVSYAEAAPRTINAVLQYMKEKGGSCKTFVGPWLIQGKGGSHCLTMPLERT